MAATTERPRSTTSSVPPASFQYQNLMMCERVTKTRQNRPTSELNAQQPLQFGQDLTIGDGFTGFIILQHGGLLIDLLCTILLGKTLLHAGLLYCLSEAVKKPYREPTWKAHTFPTEAGIFGGGATSFSRSILAIL